MTKGEIIDLVLLNVSGGNFSPDINVTRQDIATRLSAQVASSIPASKMNKELMAYRKSRNAYPDFDFRISPEFLKTYNADPIYDEVRCIYYIIPPKKIAMYGDSIDSVFPVGSNVEFIKIRDAFEVQGMPLLNTTFWYFEHNAGDKVYLLNLPLPVGTLSIRMLVDIDDLDDDEDIPIPADQIAKVIDDMVLYFKDQVQTFPEDEIADNIEDSNELV